MVKAPLSEKPQINELELCCAYCFFVLRQEEQESYRGEIVDYYVAEHARIWLHKELCRTFELSKNDTRSVTDNLSKYAFNPHKVYEALCHIKKTVEAQDKNSAHIYSTGGKK